MQQAPGQQARDRKRTQTLTRNSRWPDYLGAVCLHLSARPTQKALIA
jgi:hypothetical protein